VIRSAWLAVAILLATLALSSPAQACSFTWSPGYSPDEIKERDDVRAVRGVFRVVDVDGTAGEDGTLASGVIYGRIKMRGGKVWNTVQEYNTFWVDCGAYVQPTADAKGVFWISRTAKNGRYKMMLWDGEYLPANNPSKDTDGTETK
jgi:hypothetical protein